MVLQLEDADIVSLVVFSVLLTRLADSNEVTSTFCAFWWVLSHFEGSQLSLITDEVTC